MSEHETVELRPQPYDQGQAPLLSPAAKRIKLALEIAMLAAITALTLMGIFLLGLAAWLLTKATT